MKKLASFALGIISMSAIVSCVSCEAECDIDKKVNALYAGMTQGERLAQLHSNYLEYFFDSNGNLDTAKCRALIPNGSGHFSQYAFNCAAEPDVVRDRCRQMQEWLMQNTPSGIPALFHEEVLTGVNTYGATVYPQQIGLACSFDIEKAELKTKYTSDNLRRIGGSLALSPMVDVVRDPSFNRLEESYGEDAYLSAAMGVAFVKGLQGENLSNGVAACTKHYLGYGGGGDAQEKELMEDIILPHETAIRLASSKALMTGYHTFHGTKCVASKELQKEILRGYLGFEGLTVSDYGSIAQISDTLAPIYKAVEAFNAGNEVEFPYGENYRFLPDALSAGLISEEDFESAVKRVLRLKAELGLLDENPNLYDSGHITFDSEKERNLAYELATESVVLLKNNGVLPLKKPTKIGLTGPNANSMWAMLGDYTYHSMTYFWKMQTPDDTNPLIVNLKDGMEGRLPEGFSMEYSRGCDWTEEVETIIENAGDPRAAAMNSRQDRMVDSGEKSDEREALEMAKRSDVIIAAVGENVILSGENRDRTTLRLPGRQEEFVGKLLDTGKPVVLIVFGGRAQVISSIADRCAAVIQAWYPGEEGGNALADIIYGNVSPSGKLSVSYPAEEIRNEAICYSYGKKDCRIAWPFGYGLSYTTFEYSNLKVAAEHKCSSDNIEVSFDISNTGDFDADEIAQLYISPTDGSQNLSPIKLQGFQRVSLKSGETRNVTLVLSAEQFGYYEDKQWHVAPGEYLIKVGASSEDIRLSEKISLTGKGLTAPLRSRYFAVSR